MIYMGVWRIKSVTGMLGNAVLPSSFSLSPSSSFPQSLPPSLPPSFSFLPPPPPSSFSLLLSPEQTILAQYEQDLEFNEDALCAAIECLSTTDVICPICQKWATINFVNTRRHAFIRMTTFASIIFPAIYLPGISCTRTSTLSSVPVEYGLTQQ